jgi:hypothetical protein
MASALSVNLTLSGSAGLTGSTGLVKPSFSVPLGGASAAWAAMTASLGFGTLSGLANNLLCQQRSVGAGLNDDLDLAGSLLNDLGEAFVLSRVKLLVISIVAPDGTKKLRVGPQGLANAWQGPFGGVTAPCYKEVTHWELIVNEPVAGYLVTPGTADLLRVNNPGAGSVTYNILLAGY